MSVLPQSFSLFKRSNGVYYITYYENGRQRWKSTGATTKPDALKALTEFKELLRQRSRSVSLEEFTKEFLGFSEVNHAKKTVILFKAILNSFHSQYRHISLREITAEHIDKYKAKRLKEVSPVSVNVELRMLRSALNTARRWKLKDEDAFDGVALAQVPDQSPVFLTRSDFQRLLDCIKEYWLKEIVAFAVMTGMRRGEILNLKWIDLDLDNRTVQIQTSDTFHTKQGKRRIVPLGDGAVQLLKSKAGRSPSEYVFSLRDEKIFDGWVTHLFKRCVRDAGLNDRLHFHSLRHTFASWLVQDGVSLYEVQKLLGHSSSEVTQIYSHLQPEQLHSTVNRISIEMN